MRCVGSVPRVFCTLGILAIGMTSVAQAAANRKAIQQERENRVQSAVQARSTGDPKGSPSASPKSPTGGPGRSELGYILRLVATEQRSLAYENSLIAAENRLIAQQNLVIHELNSTKNPLLVHLLDNEALSLQASINRELTFIEAIQPAINATLTALKPYASVIPGIFNSLQSAVTRDNSEIAVIAARPPFTIPPATASI